MSSEPAGVPSPATRAPGGAALQIRDLETRDEYEACTALQYAIWGADFLEAVPPAILQLEHDLGGIVAAAFDPRGDAVGFVFGMSGFVDGRPLHWSHMLGVLPGYRGHGLGRNLKAHQRDRLLAAGIDEARWTFDPLEARNAHLNLNRLGARAIRYAVDRYGDQTGSSLHRGLGTDRLIARWSLDADRTRRALRGDAPEPELPSEKGDPPILDPVAGDAPCDPGSPGSAGVRIRVPLRIQRVKNDDLGAAVRWRESVREAFRMAADAGLGVAGFQRRGDFGYYVLLPAGAGGPPALDFRS